MLNFFDDFDLDVQKATIIDTSVSRPPPVTLSCPVCNHPSIYVCGHTLGCPNTDYSVCVCMVR